MIYVLAYPVFERDVAVRLDRFRAEHEPERAAMVAPHVTLVFGLSASKTEAVCRACDRLAREIPAFQIEFERKWADLDTGEGLHKLFLMVGAGGAVLTRLYRELNAGIAEEAGHIAFHPHMTVAS